MKARHFHHQPRLGVTAIGRIAHAVEDDDQIETWMIDQAQEPGGNRHTVVGLPNGACYGADQCCKKTLKYRWLHTWSPGFRQGSIPNYKI